MTDAEYATLVDAAVAALRAVMRVDATQIEATVSRCHSVMHVIDPTAYRNGLQSLDDQEVIARAIVAAQRVVLKSDRLTMLLSAADAADGHIWPCLSSVGTVDA